jgi:ribose 5-phosphate isomerase B
MEDKPKILIAGDHAGYALKVELVPAIQALGYDVEDMGAYSFDAEDDYPDFMTPLAERLAAEPKTIGIGVGGSGQGEAMAANRIPNVRAAVFYGQRRVVASLELEGGGSEDGYDVVRLSRRHNDANFLSIGARFVSVDEATEAVRIFLETPFTAPERHARRLAKF